MVKEPERLELRNAIIKGAEISADDHGFLSAWLFLDYDGLGQGFGGYALYLPKSYAHHNLESPAGHFIWRVMEVVGVTKWNDLPGKTIRVRQNQGIVWEIGHIIKEDWFCPARDFELVTEKNKEADGAD